MKRPLFLLFLCIAPLAAQTPMPATPDWMSLPQNTVIAKIDGEPITVAQFNAFAAVFVPNEPSAKVRLMADPGLLIRDIAFMRKMAKVAIEHKLEENSPLREQLEYNRLVLMAQAATGYLMATVSVDDQEVQTYYNTHRDQFEKVKVKAIYIPFSASPGAQAGGKKGLSEAEAKAKAERLLAAIKGGADFVKLVRENSEDATSKARDGDFATVTPADNIPDAMRTAVFSLKQGETSEPVRQANGYYLLRADEISYQPLSEVRDQVFGRIQGQKGHEVLDKIHNDLNVEILNPAFQIKQAPSH